MHTFLCKKAQPRGRKGHLAQTIFVLSVDKGTARSLTLDPAGQSGHELRETFLITYVSSIPRAGQGLID